MHHGGPDQRQRLAQGRVTHRVVRRRRRRRYPRRGRRRRAALLRLLKVVRKVRTARFGAEADDGRACSGLPGQSEQVRGRPEVGVRREPKLLRRPADTQRSRLGTRLGRRRDSALQLLPRNGRQRVV